MYINNTIQTTSFWKLYRELHRNVQPALNCISPQKRIKARSFELASKSMYIEEVKLLPKQKQKKIIKYPTILAQFGIPIKRSSKVEGTDILEILSQQSLDIQDQKIQPQGKIRRVTFHEYQGQKQKRLNHLVPHTQVYQHSHEAVIVKKKKINRLKNQYKFLQRSRQRKTNGEQKSKSCPLKRQPKITHKRAKSIADQIYQGPILPIDFELQRKIALFCFQKRRNTLLMFRRKTCIQDRKTMFVAKDKLLNFQETLQKHFKQHEEQYETSGESSPLPNKLLQFRQSTNLKTKTQIPEKPQLTPRYINNNEYSIFHRKTSFNIINKYLQEKQVSNKFCLSPPNQQMPKIQSPTLKEINLYFISTKRNTENIVFTQQFLEEEKQKYIYKFTLTVCNQKYLTLLVNIESLQRYLDFQPQIIIIKQLIEQQQFYQFINYIYHFWQNLLCNNYTSKLSQYTQQGQLKSQISIHTSRSNGIKEIDDLQLHQTTTLQIKNFDFKKLSQNTSITHIKTQPCEHQGTKTKQYYLKKLKPYYQ